MFLQRGSRLLRHASIVSVGVARGGRAPLQTRRFSGSGWRWAIKPVLLADIGEGIVECEVIQWFVEPGAHVDEFSPLCEVQSDKASVEITSRFAGTVKKLHYEPGEMAKVGQPFVDIDIAGDDPTPTPTPIRTPEQTPLGNAIPSPVEQRRKGKMAALATPAVRHVSRELDVDIAQVEGSGRDGRVLKEDLYRFVKMRDAEAGQPVPSPPDVTPPTPPPTMTAGEQSEQTERRVPLTQTQQQMFKTMTRSLSIPHFLYADEIDLSDLLSYLPFIIKAVSLALYQYPLLNGRVDLPESGGKPSLVLRSRHDVGVAMDTPQGLVVPVVRDVGNRTIVAIASELSRLQRRALAGRLSPADMSGGTVTVSNVGNIGGTYLSPVIVEREVAILGIGRLRAVPAFDGEDRVVKRHVCNFSWSADHRVVDGATLARAAGVVRRVVEEPDVMLMHLR
ncbi:dihydrolipoamide branched chain transacylase E2 [Ophiocordyceps camponoti-floridani]|uniref:Dihydrolipoamide acetyltransferase component of pyruvate dehydrogenase complex n=1 Tax=Ophiocordyceps camponoti-floridani TaxID=2030778 RepID=A0A8H4Q118_9HYPO|nr:dihydrolipoamide branched chain transacylase E2 [Ophiocordyceps camponoti-floridani]